MLMVISVSMMSLTDPATKRQRTIRKQQRKSCVAGERPMFIGIQLVLLALIIRHFIPENKIAAILFSGICVH
jgi:hypothetical protein